MNPWSSADNNEAVSGLSVGVSVSFERVLETASKLFGFAIGLRPLGYARQVDDPAHITTISSASANREAASLAGLSPGRLH